MGGAPGLCALHCGGMRAFLFAATAGAAALFVAALGLFGSMASGVRWQALERPVERPGRVPAVELPEEPIVTAMTASDVDSVPEALEARPRPARPAAPEEDAAGLGDFEPRSPKRKAGPRKSAPKRPSLFRRVGLGRARPGLQMGPGLSFDGGGSGASSGLVAPGGAAEDEASTAPAAARVGGAPAPRRQFRAVTPVRGTSEPAPVAPPQEYEFEEGEPEEP